MEKSWKDAIIEGLCGVGRQNTLCSCRVSSNIEDAQRIKDAQAAEPQQAEEPA